MSRSNYAFAFPRPLPTSFQLLSDSTVGYLDDSIFYKLDLNTGKAEALQYLFLHPATLKDALIKPLPPSTNAL